MSDTVLRDFGLAYPLAPRVGEVFHDSSSAQESAPGYRVRTVVPRDEDDYYPVTAFAVDVAGHIIENTAVASFRIRWSDWYKTWRVFGTWR